MVLVQSNNFTVINITATILCLSYNEFAKSMKYAESSKCESRIGRGLNFVNK